MRRTPPTVPAAAVVLAAVVLAAVALLVGALLVGALRGPDRDAVEPGPPLGAVLDDADRRALGAVAVQRGAGPAPADPAVDLADPAAVARAYLVAARTVSPDDGGPDNGGPDAGGRTQLRAAAYAVPGSPPAAVGVVVLDPPPPGQARTVAVTTVDLVGADEADRRRAYRATLATATGPPGGAGGPAVGTAFVVLARQPDGRWLVAADTPDLPEGDD